MIDVLLSKTLKYFRGFKGEVHFFSPHIEPVSGILRKPRVKEDERGVTRVQEVVIEINGNKKRYKLENIMYIVIKGDTPIEIEPEKKVIEDKSISSWRIINKCIKEKTPCTFFLFKRKVLRGFIKAVSPYSFILLDLDKKDIIILFKHSVKFWVPLNANLKKLKEYKVILCDKKLPLAYRKIIARRIYRREWQFPKELKGRKLKKYLKKRVRVITREGGVIEGIMKTLTFWDIVVANEVYPVVIFRHALLDILKLE